MSVLAKYRRELRKRIAELKIQGVRDQASKWLMTTYKKALQNPNPPQEDILKVVGPLDLSLNRLIATLEQLLAEEQDPSPSQTDIERWALKAAVLDYYKGLNLSGATKVIDDPNQNKTIHQFAPDKRVIYGLWLQKLADLTKKEGVNQFALPKYDQDVERGTVQGGAFEKQLNRYREQFVKEMIERQGQ